MHPEIETFLTRLPAIHPQTYKAVYPRRITPPGGYLNPKYFSVSLWSALEVGFQSEMNMLPHITGLMNALTLLEYRVPTFFVRSEFAQAVAQTEPPADFKFGEIKWPMPAMLFVLPTDFVMRYFGFNVPFLSVSRSAIGTYPAMFKNMPKCEMPIHAVHPVENRMERFSVVYPVYSEHNTPVDYTGTYPMTLNVNQIDQAPYEDATYMEEARLKQEFGDYGLDRSQPDLPAEGEAERLFNSKVQSFAVKLMLALTAQPNFITIGTQSRKTKIKHGRVRDEIWNPNLIGWDYKAKRVPTEGGAEGTHASPRLHWRRGHMRNQPYGPKPWTDTSSKRLTWIEPCLISADNETA